MLLKTAIMKLLSKLSVNILALTDGPTSVKGKDHHGIMNRTRMMQQRI